MRKSSSPFAGMVVPARLKAKESNYWMLKVEKMCDCVGQRKEMGAILGAGQASLRQEEIRSRGENDK